MNFISNVLDALPVVGHAKAAIHLLAGDKDGAGRALYHATRTSAVLLGGVIGSIAGPVESEQGAVVMGAITDTVASITMNKPQGIFRDAENINTDIRAGRNCTESLVWTGVHMCFDAVGGLGMSGLFGASVENVRLTVASNIEEEIAEKSVEEVAKQAVVISSRTSAKIAAQDVVQKAVKLAVNKRVERTVAEKSVEMIAKKVAVRSAETAVIRVASTTAETAAKKVVVKTAGTVAVRVASKSAETAAKRVVVQTAETAAKRVVVQTAETAAKKVVEKTAETAAKKVVEKTAEIAGKKAIQKSLGYSLLTPFRGMVEGEKQMKEDLGIEELTEKELVMEELSKEELVMENLSKEESMEELL